MSVPESVRRIGRGLVASLQLAAALALLGAAAASAQDAPALPALPGFPGTEKKREPFELSADALEYDARRNLYVASGNVVIVQGEKTLKADWIAFSRDTGAGVASGSVELTEGGDTLRAHFVEFNANDLEGVVFQGEFDSEESQFRGSGARIAKTGENTYRFEEGVFTTCRCPEPDDLVPWAITAEEADIEVEGYGTARNTTVEILGVPALWFPWMIYPIKTERSTGFLFPRIELGSRNGFAVGVPFFWAARDDLNVTLTPSFSSKRGPKLDAELEYVFGLESKINLFGAFAYDLDIDPRSEASPFDRSRWALVGDGDIHLPENLRFKTDFRFASDNQYVQDYEELELYRFDRYLESIAMLEGRVGPSGRYGGSLWATYADDLQNPDNRDRDAILLHRLPSVEAEVLPSPDPFFGWLQPSIEMEYTWFNAFKPAKEKRPFAVDRGPFLDTGVDSLPDPQEIGFLTFLSTIDPDPHLDDFYTFFLGAPLPNLGPERDARFLEGEPLSDRGHRFLFQPRVAAPFQLGPLEVYPEAGWHETLYASTRRSAARGFATGRVDVRTRLERHYESGLHHVIEPRLGWALVASSDFLQRGNPIFVPRASVPQERLRELDLDVVTRDSADRIEPANDLVAGVGNRLYGHPFDPEARSRLLADVSLLARYDLRGGAMGNLLLDGVAYPLQAIRSRFHASYDLANGRMDEALFDVGYTHPAGHVISGGYRLIQDTPLFFEDFLVVRSGVTDRFRNFQDIGRVDQLFGNFALSLTKQWSISYTVAYSLDKKLNLANTGTILYTSRCRCWSLGLRVTDDRARGPQFRVLYEVLGLGKKPRAPREGLLDLL